MNKRVGVQSSSSIFTRFHNFFLSFAACYLHHVPFLFDRNVFVTSLFNSFTVQTVKVLTHKKMKKSMQMHVEQNFGLFLHRLFIETYACRWSR